MELVMEEAKAARLLEWVMEKEAKVMVLELVMEKEAKAAGVVVEGGTS
jgi:hypothetical protein